MAITDDPRLRKQKELALAPAVELAIPEKKFLPPRIIIHAEPGWGKTSLGAFAPNSAILVSPDETGYFTLLGADQVPAIPAAKVESWLSFLKTLDAIAENPPKVLVLDSLGGFNKLSETYVCDKEYKGVRGNGGFARFREGYRETAILWYEALERLDKFYNNGCMVLILSHCAVKTIADPDGGNSKAWTSDIDAAEWQPFVRWADAIFFGRFEKPQNKKDTSGKRRILYTQNDNAFCAKNRLGLPEQIYIPDDPSKAFGVLMDAIKNRKKFC